MQIFQFALKPLLFYCRAIGHAIGGFPILQQKKLLASWQFNRLKNADNIILYLAEYMLNCRVLHAPLISLLLTSNKALMLTLIQDIKVIRIYISLNMTTYYYIKSGNITK